MHCEYKYGCDYISPEEATHIRVFEDFDGYALDAADDKGNYTEVIWTHYDNQLLTREKAIAVAGEFAKEIGRPDLALKVSVSGKTLKPTCFRDSSHFLVFSITVLAHCNALGVTVHFLCFFWE